MKKKLLLLLIVSLVMSTFICISYAGEYEGKYIGSSLTSDEPSYEFRDLFPDGFTITLKSLGRCVFSINGTDYNGKWLCSGTAFSANFNDGTFFSGIFNDNTLTLNDVYGVNILFYLEGTVPETSSRKDLLVRPSDNSGSIFLDQLQWWNRDWYGFWIVDEVEGLYSDWEDNWWDCCAAIEFSRSNVGYLTVWDEHSTFNEPFVYARVSASDSGKSQRGTLSCSGGSMYNMMLSKDEWVIDPSAAYYDDMLSITGHYEDDDGSFEYTIILRPWGMLWDDIEEDDLDFYSTYYYDDWYLPLLESGAASAPDGYVGIS